MPERHNDRSAAPDFAALVGYVIRLPEPGVAELELELAASHCNRLGTVHGGVIMTLLDTAGMWACTEAGSAPVCPTVSLTCNFMKGVRITDTRTLRARGTISRKGKRTYFSAMTLHAGDDLVATAIGVYAAPPPAQE